MIIESNASVAFSTMFWSYDLILITDGAISFFYEHTIPMMNTLIYSILFIMCRFWWLLLFDHLLDINLLLYLRFSGRYLVVRFCTSLWNYLGCSNLLSWTLCKWCHFWGDSWLFRCLVGVRNFTVWKILFIDWSFALHFIFIIFFSNHFN